MAFKIEFLYKKFHNWSLYAVHPKGAKVKMDWDATISLSEFCSTWATLLAIYYTIITSDSIIKGYFPQVLPWYFCPLLLERSWETVLLSTCTFLSSALPFSSSYSCLLALTRYVLGGQCFGLQRLGRQGEVLSHFGKVWYLSIIFSIKCKPWNRFEPPSQAAQ